MTQVKMLRASLSETSGNVYYGDLRRPDFRDLSELLEDNEYTQHVTEPTHVGGNILDLVITRDTPDNIVAGVSVDTLLSDHNIVQCNLLLVKPSRPRQKITYRKYAAINNIEFMSDLEQSTLFTNPSDQITGMSRQYKSTITGLIDKHMRHSSPVSLQYDRKHHGSTKGYPRRNANSDKPNDDGDIRG